MSRRSWWAGPVVVAAVVGLLLGGGLYVLHPLRLTAAGVPPAPGSSPSASAPSTLPPGPLFTERALLQPSEFKIAHWVTAEQLIKVVGVTQEPILRCVQPERVETEPVAAFAATHQGRTTLAGEQVIRYHDKGEAAAVWQELAAGVADCETLDTARRAHVGKKHDPDLSGISQVRWWNLRSVDPDGLMRGVLAIVRVDDRLMVLSLTSNATDPADTTDIVYLMHQGGLRLV